MADCFVLFSKRCDTLTKEQVQAFVDGKRPRAKKIEHGVCYTYRWPDLTIRIKVLSKSRLAERLPNYEALVDLFCRNETAKFSRNKLAKHGKRMIRRLRQTRLYVQVELDPDRDKECRAGWLIGRMRGELRPMIFHVCVFYDWKFRELLEPEGTFDSEAVFD
ncbi:MAG: hypothetical protein EXS05_18050 [Planctomycetaceae bacterium]|nr:hypothetical protein [Planctomycetaceae bacterium]